MVKNVRVVLVKMELNSLKYLKVCSKQSKESSISIKYIIVQTFYE